jgi:hypothetical protein
MIYSDLALAQRLERTEAQGNVGFVETRARLTPDSGAQWLTVAGAYAMFDGPESPLTQTFGLGLFDEVTASDLAKLEAFFQAREAPVLHEVSPLASPSLLPLLTERGYQPLEYTTVLYQPISPEFQGQPNVNPQLQTRIIGEADIEVWARTAAAGWSSEGPELADFIYAFGQISARSTTSFLAELNGQPIATGGLVMHESVALLAGASTVPAGRRLRHAAQQGCTIAMMCALPGSQSQRNAEKQGFRIAYTRTKWQLPR